MLIYTFVRNLIFSLAGGLAVSFFDGPKAVIAVITVTLVVTAVAAAAKVYWAYRIQQANDALEASNGYELSEGWIHCGTIGPPRQS